MIDIVSLGQKFNIFSGFLSKKYLVFSIKKIQKSISNTELDLKIENQLRSGLLNNLKYESYKRTSITPEDREFFIKLAATKSILKRNSENLFFTHADKDNFIFYQRKVKEQSAHTFEKKKKNIR